MATTRIDALDSVRGLAACSVMLAHMTAVVPAFSPVSQHQRADSAWVNAVSYTPLHIFWAADEAVIMFFVLSGFVLALPFLGGRAPSFCNFVIRRICRIYIPYVFGLVVALLVIGAAPSAELLPERFRPADVSAGTIVGYLAMSGFSHHAAVNNVVWTLVHEMRISLVFPFLYWAVTALPRSLRVAASLVLSMACVEAEKRIGLSGEVWTTLAKSFLDTGGYVWLFVVGIELARHRERLVDRVSRLSYPIKVALVVVAVLLYTAHSTVPDMTRTMMRYPAGAGSALFIVLALSSWSMGRTLTMKPMLFLGRTSYSIYLFHWLMIELLVYTLYLRFGAVPVLLLTPPLTFAFAAAAYALVELPAIRLGRYLVKADRRGSGAEKRAHG